MKSTYKLDPYMEKALRRGWRMVPSPYGPSMFLSFQHNPTNELYSVARDGSDPWKRLCEYAGLLDKPIRYVIRNNQAGKFKKLGGGLTDDLQKAEIIGWDKTNINKWKKRGYELVPVKIGIIQ
jgi:hypothetical protein